MPLPGKNVIETSDASLSGEERDHIQQVEQASIFDWRLEIACNYDLSLSNAQAETGRQ